MRKNTIWSVEEYMAQGFTAEEVPLIIEHDTIFNKWEEATEEEKERLFFLVEKLGL